MKNTTETPHKIAKKYICKICDYECSKKCDFNKHLRTIKHNTTNTTQIQHKFANACQCGKIYSHRASLYNHKKSCNYIAEEQYIHDTNDNIINDIDKELLIKMLLKNQDVMEGVILKNQDVMEKMMEIMPQIGNTVNTNSHNTTNNQFNIHMFLNDHCKNAMNLTDFIHSLPITNETYDDTIENGLTKTITNIMVNGLNDLDILERPIHCTDASRKTLYVKDSDKWERDNEMLHMMKGIKELSLKQRTLIRKWKEANSGWDTDDNLQSRMTSLVFNSMTQIEDDEKETSKIIRSISKNVYLNNCIKNEYK